MDHVVHDLVTPTSISDGIHVMAYRNDLYWVSLLFLGDVVGIYHP